MIAAPTRSLSTRLRLPDVSHHALNVWRRNRDVILDDGAVVDGSVYAERDLVVGVNAVIAEHAVTAGSTVVRSRGRIGSAGRITTLLADGIVELWLGAVVYGRIVAGRGGTTRSGSNSHNPVKRLAE